jgi:GntR family transcriptional repressor for pyruvate dehydrogenase complex
VQYLYDDLITASSSSSTVRVSAPPQPQPLVVDRLSDRLAALLGAQIESGALRAGDRLPTEQQLATAHGVSRTVVREAVHQLKSRGLLRSRQGSGVYVTAPPAAALKLDLSLIASLDDVMQLREVRRALEAETAALAAERATRLQVAALRRAL